MKKRNLVLKMRMRRFAPLQYGEHLIRLKPYLTRDQYRLYRLIWERFVASQMANAVMDAVTAHIHAGEAVFRATGSKVKFQGFMKVYIEGDDDHKSKKKNAFLPSLTTGDRLRKKKIEPKQHFTQPPPRYTEAKLVKTLEEKGSDDRVPMPHVKHYSTTGLCFVGR